MNTKARLAFTFILIFVLASSFLVLPGLPLSPVVYCHLRQVIQTVVFLSAEPHHRMFCSSGALYGTDGTTLLRMETVGVTLGMMKYIFRYH